MRTQIFPFLKWWGEKTISYKIWRIFSVGNLNNNFSKYYRGQTKYCIPKLAAGMVCNLHLLCQALCWALWRIQSEQSSRLAGRKLLGAPGPQSVHKCLGSESECGGEKGQGDQVRKASCKKRPLSWIVWIKRSQNHSGQRKNSFEFLGKGRCFHETTFGVYGNCGAEPWSLSPDHREPPVPSRGT